MQHETSENRTISIVEAGEWLGIGRTLAYAAAHRGEIPTIRIGRVLRVPVVQLESLLRGDNKVPRVDLNQDENQSQPSAK
jgi:excisionase family DNA binding protein